MASAPRVTTSGPLVPVMMSVLLAMNAEAWLSAANAYAVSAGPADTKPTATVATMLRPACGRERSCKCS